MQKQEEYYYRACKLIEIENTLETKFLNKKRKNSENSLKSTEDDINFNDRNNNEITESYIKNKEIMEKVIEINMENDEFVALVEKRMENGKIKFEKIKTKILKLENPWILINYYEQNNIF